ncbi:putative glycosyltransferase At3g42180 [Wolffia australiana]
MSANEFCLFFHGYGGDFPIGEAMKAGCVPIVVSDRPILDLPFSDVVDWSEIALFVALQEGGGFVRRAIDRIDEEKRARMRASAAQVSSLFRFEDGFLEGDREPRDAFHAVIFQLWCRRHTIRYAGGIPFAG